MIKQLKLLFYKVIGNCDICEYTKVCDHIIYGGGHCWDYAYDPHYKRRKR